MTAACLVGLVAIALAVGASPLFHVKTVEITGTSELGRGDILEAAGLRSDTNLITLSPRDVEDRIVADPWIRTAVVERHFPSTLVITVTERVPAVAVRRDGTYWIVAADGVTLGESPREPGLPPVKGARPAPVGETTGPMAAAAAVAAAWPDVVLAEDPQIGIAPDGSVTVELRRHITVDYGIPTDPAQKAQALAGVLVWAQRNKERLASIDLRVPGAPAAELANGRTENDPNVSGDSGAVANDGANERGRKNEESPTPTL
ncbi:MAG: FtsQ-type POTRA domain-containing protein [Actinomycetota bacterium]